MKDYLIPRDALDREIWRRETLGSFAAFANFANDGFYLSMAHKVVCAVLEKAWAAKTGKALNVCLCSTPPRFGKSHLITSTAPVYRALKIPGYETIITAYGTDLAKSFSLDCRNKFVEVAGVLAPHLKLSDSVASAENWHAVSSRGGTAKVHAAGMGAPITGFGGDDLYGDDWLKGASELDSGVKMKTLIARLSSDIQSRIYPNGLLWLTGTPWAENDPFGWIREHWSEQLLYDIKISAMCWKGNADILSHESLVALGLVENGETTTYEEERKVVEHVYGDNYMSGNILYELLETGATVVPVDSESRVVDGFEFILGNDSRVATVKFEGLGASQYTRYRITQRKGRVNGQSFMGPQFGDSDIPPRINSNTEWLQSKRALILSGVDEDNIGGLGGKRTWDALYMCEPTGSLSTLFDLSAVRDCDLSINQADLRLSSVSFSNEAGDSFSFHLKNAFTFLSVDATFGKSATSDFVAIGVYAVWNNLLFKLAVFNLRLDFGETYNLILDIVNNTFKDLIDEVLIEGKANGDAIISSLRTIWYEKGSSDGDWVKRSGAPAVRRVTPSSDKERRAQATLPFINARSLFVASSLLGKTDSNPSHTPSAGVARHYELFDQMRKFPFAAHDDMVDELTMAISRASELISVGDAAQEKVLYSKYREWHPEMLKEFDSLRSDSERSAYIHKYGAPLQWLKSTNKTTTSPHKIIKKEWNL